VSDDLVGEEGEAVADGLGIDEAHGFLVAGVADEAVVVGCRASFEIATRAGTRAETGSSTPTPMGVYANG
jgi:hypothetical protein